MVKEDMKKFLSTIVLTCLLFLLVACGNQTPPTPTQEPIEETSAQLSWFHEYSVAVFHAAEKNGHFAKENLKVDLVEGGFTDAGFIDPIAQVLEGNVDFGVTDASNILLARASGKPIIAIASIMQRSPTAIVSLKAKGITRPQDLVGKTIAVNGGATNTLNSLLSSQNIDPTSVTIVDRTSFGIDMILNDEVDGILAWIINEGVMVEEAGEEANIMLMSDYAVDTYNFVVFTTEETVTERPDMVQHFVNALVAGTKDVISNPEQAIENTLTYNAELDKDAQLRRLNASIPLINVPGLEHASMQESVWESTHQVLLEQGTLDEAIDITGVFTNQFVDVANQTES